MILLLWLLAVSFLCGFAFLDPVILAMRWEDRIDYEAYEARGRIAPTLHSLVLIAAFWQSAVGALVFLALWLGLQRVEMGWSGTVVVGMFIVATLWTVGFVLWAPKTPRLPVIVSSMRAALMAAATWVIYAST